jgi:hypothetical protein
MPQKVRDVKNDPNESSFDINRERENWENRFGKG